MAVLATEPGRLRAAPFQVETVSEHRLSSYLRQVLKSTRLKQALDVISSGRIHYKDVDIQDASVRVIGTTAIVLNRIRLTAMVCGNEVVNPFVVTEMYVKQGEAWKLASLSFTRLLAP